MIVDRRKISGIGDQPRSNGDEDISGFDLGLVACDFGRRVQYAHTSRHIIGPTVPRASYHGPVEFALC